MKDFMEFVQMANESGTMGQIVDDVNVRFKDMDDDIGLGNQIAFISYQIALDLLGLYHKWSQTDD